MFTSHIGKLSNTQDIDILCNWIFDAFNNDLQVRQSMHVYIKNLPVEVKHTSLICVM
jgi:hypothetical protein